MNKKTLIAIIAAVAVAVIAAIIVISSMFGVKTIDIEKEGVKMEEVEKPEAAETSAEGEAEAAGEKAEESAEKGDKKEEKPVDKADENKQQKAEKPAEEEKVYTPTFVYFMSDATADSAEDVLDKLKKEYDGKVQFDIRNVNEDDSGMIDAFGEESLPVLMMHDRQNNPCAILMSATDYDELKSAIETALAN